MKEADRAFLTICSAVITMLIVAGFVAFALRSVPPPATFYPSIPVPEPLFSELRTGYFDAAFVLGKHGGRCNDPDLARMISRYAARTRVPARILAAVIVKESSCNPFAVSHKGAIGLTQLHSFTWCPVYDCELVNPFERKSNIEIGAQILRLYYEDTGDWKLALRKYNGKGEETLEFASAVMKLAAY